MKRLIHDVAFEGLNEIVWDGTDSRGRRAGSGVYFYRLEAAGQESKKKMALLR